jgi:hypothetical protein
MGNTPIKAILSHIFEQQSRRSWGDLSQDWCVFCGALVCWRNVRGALPNRLFLPVRRRRESGLKRRASVNWFKPEATLCGAPARPWPGTGLRAVSQQRIPED